MKYLWRLKTTRSRIAFSRKEQPLTCLSIALNYLDYEVSPAELKAGDPVDLITFQSLLTVAQSVGFDGQYITWKSWIEKAKLNDIVIANLGEKGTVLIQKRRKDRLLVNDPLNQTVLISANELNVDDNNFDCLKIENPSHLKRNNFDRMMGIVLVDKRFKDVSLVLLGVAFLHSLVSLIDPVIKNVYFSNVVQLGMTDWARTLSIGYILITVLSGILLLIGGLLGYLFTSRLALFWSYSSFSSLLRMPESYMQMRTRGDLLNRIRSSESLASFFGTEEVQLLGALINSCIVFVILASTSLTMMLAYSAFLLSGLIYVFTTNRGWKHRSDLLQQDQAIEVGSFVRLLNSVKNLQYEQRVAEAFRVHQLLIGTRIHSQQQMSLYAIYVRFGSTIIDTIKSAVLLVMAALLIIDGKISLGEYIGFSALLGQLIQPTRLLTSFVSKFQSMHAVLDRVTDVIDEARIQKQRGINQANNLLEIKSKNSEKDQDEILVDERSTNFELVFSGQQAIIDWESYFCGDEWLPGGLEINLLFDKGKRQVLFARLSPYLFKGSVKDNIEIGQKYYDPDITPLLKNAFAILGLDALSLKQDIESIYDIENGMWILGIVRVLYQRPKAIMIPVINKSQQKLVYALLQCELVSRCNITIIAIRSSQCDVAVFEKTYSMQSFEVIANKSKNKLSTLSRLPA